MRHHILTRIREILVGETRGAARMQPIDFTKHRGMASSKR
jgi:hypothetical protein